MSIRALLLDLDGTLADTAPDLGAALNQLLAEESRPALAAEVIRPVASNGARGLLKIGFDLTPDDPRYEGLRTRLLDFYMQGIALETRLFPGMLPLLESLDEENIPWGIVTNKPTWLTGPLLEALSIAPAPATVVCGDTLSKAKPHPEPMHHAAQQLGLPCAQCAYVGDAPRDIEAARAAGMPAIAAGWGYLPESPAIEAWGADAIAWEPSDLGHWLAQRIKAAGLKSEGLDPEPDPTLAANRPTPE